MNESEPLKWHVIGAPRRKVVLIAGSIFALGVLVLLIFNIFLVPVSELLNDGRVTDEEESRTLMRGWTVSITLMTLSWVILAAGWYLTGEAKPDETSPPPSR